MLDLQEFRNLIFSDIKLRAIIYDYDGYFLREETDTEFRERLKNTPCHKIAMMELNRY